MNQQQIHRVTAPGYSGSVNGRDVDSYVLIE